MVIFMGEVGMAALIAYFLFSVFCLSSCEARDKLTPNRGLKDDGETIVSGGGKFALGFFSPNNRSRNRYVGIWYTSESERPVPVIWVANREAPLTDLSGAISIENGSLIITAGERNILWSTPTALLNSSATLMDTGNLVSFSETTGETLWQSFDHPGSAFLPNMKIGFNVNTNRSQFLRSWKDPSDPSVGKFSLGISPPKPYQIKIWRGSELYWRSGPWNSRAFLGISGMSSTYLNGFSMADEGGSVNFMYASFSDSESNQTLISLNSTGNIEQLEWDVEKKVWFSSWTALTSKCDVYGTCGPWGVCDTSSSPLCSCSRGFEPRFREEWNRGNWTGGCERMNPLMSCGANSSNFTEKKGDGFVKLQNMKPPDSIAWLSFDESEGYCEGMCLRNCSCVAYAFDVGIGCMFWSRQLMDLQKFPVAGVDLYIRLPASDIGVAGGKKHVKVIIITVVVLGTTIICVFLFLMWRWLAKHRETGQSDESEEKGVKKLIEKPTVGREVYDDLVTKNAMPNYLEQEEGPELLKFDFEVVASATNYFSPANKLGGGGFGPVYKGRLPGGQEVAVKRLSKSSGQGMQEFRNEVLVICRVQHKNLVRLLGYCIQGEEKMLLYEYMPNKSLDAFIFDSNERKLDWAQRFDIIEGVARGLLYLHRDSRLKIIHRDLKASNILLDNDLNPKISDFGLARIIGGSQIQANTRRVVGTYGYMSPEYAMEGRFSEKSDVFSFGVLLLEIVSGKKNTSFYNEEHSLNLLSHAWKLWNDGQALELIDPILGSTYSEAQVMRCIHVGLLCVQEFAADRPFTSALTLYLGSDTAIPPNPKQPAFTATTSRESVSPDEGGSVNEYTVTTLEGR